MLSRVLWECYRNPSSQQGSEWIGKQGKTGAGVIPSPQLREVSIFPRDRNLRGRSEAGQARTT